MAKNIVTDAQNQDEHRPGEPQLKRLRDKMLDKTLADSFPTSDPPSSLPDPCAEDSFDEDKAA